MHLLVRFLYAWCLIIPQIIKNGSFQVGFIISTGCNWHILDLCAGDLSRLIIPQFSFQFIKRFRLLIRRVLIMFSLLCLKAGNVSISIPTSSWNCSAPIFSRHCNVGVADEKWPPLLFENSKLSCLRYVKECKWRASQHTGQMPEDVFMRGRSDSGWVT